MLIILVSIPIVLFMAYKFISPKRPANFPPGLDGSPIIGSVKMIQEINPRPTIAMTKLGEIYGPACGVFLGRYPAVIVNGWETTQEILTREEFQYRPDLSAFQMGDHFAKDTLGSLWKMEHRLATTAFGNDDTTVEKLIQSEGVELVKYIKEKFTSAQTLQMVDIFRYSVINIIWTVLTGKKYARDDPEMIKLMATLNSFISSGVGFGSLINGWPMLKYIPPFSHEYNNVVVNLASMDKIIKNEIALHKANPIQTNPTNLIDLYFSELDKRSKTPGASKSEFTDKQLLRVFTGTILAGIDGISNILTVSILYMLVYPEIQEKVQEEIDRVLKHEPASLVDRERLPYVEAVLMELFRVASPVPIAVPHCTNRDTTLNGFNIPKDTDIHINFYSMRMDKGYWKDPETFRPERFLDSAGKFVNPERVMPFSAGTRQCAGQSLANGIHFLLFLKMMQEFEIERDMSQPIPSLEPFPRLTEAPRPFMAKLIPRK